MQQELASPPPPPPGPAAEAAAPTCAQPEELYAGGITSDATDYTHRGPKGDDFVEAPVEGLDRVTTTATRGRFTLDVWIGS